MRDLCHSFVIHLRCTYFAGKSCILIVCLFTFVVTAYFVSEMICHISCSFSQAYDRIAPHHAARDASVGFSTVLLQQADKELFR